MSRGSSNIIVEYHTLVKVEVRRKDVFGCTVHFVYTPTKLLLPSTTPSSPLRTSSSQNITWKRRSRGVSSEEIGTVDCDPGSPDRPSLGVLKEKSPSFPWSFIPSECSSGVHQEGHGEVGWCSKDSCFLSLLLFLHLYQMGHWYETLRCYSPRGRVHGVESRGLSQVLFLAPLGRIVF